MLPPGYDSTTRRRRRRRRPKQDDAGSLRSTSEESAAKQQQQQPDWFWDWVGEPFVQTVVGLLLTQTWNWLMPRKKPPKQPIYKTL